jgi:predicted metal-binding membrane protein
MVELTAAQEMKMEDSQIDPISAQRNVILGLLVALCAGAWAWLAWQGAGMHQHPGSSLASPTMGMQAPLFVAMWMAMTVAMMFPTAAPMLLTFHKTQENKRQRGQAFVATWAFLAGYMIVWMLSGVAAYLGEAAFESIASRAAFSAETTFRFGGAILVAAGLYQLTPIKDMCLSKCRTPLSFIMTTWRDGVKGAVQMGVLHGAYCLGCCWLLCAIMFPLGMMNLAALATVTVVVFAEKTLPRVRPLARATAVILSVCGGLVIIAPEVLSALAGL